jgi:hypothetical protein
LAAQGAGSKNLGKQIIDAGGKVIEVLDDTRANLDAWITTHNLNITSLIDAPGMAGKTLTLLGIRETSIIIKMPEMKIVYLNHGNQSGFGDTGVVAAKAEIVRLLSMP